MDQAILNVVKQVDVVDDLVTLALDESLSEGWGPEWDSNSDETVLREPVFSDQVL